MRRLLALSAPVLLAISLAACGDDDDDDPTVGADTSEATTATTAAPDGEPVEGDATVVLGESDLGEHLVDAGGMTLYLFTQDGEGSSACTGGCATTWPPLVVEGDPIAGDGLDQALVGTIERDDGTTQVTYNGHPLYTYANDRAPGDTTGHGVGEVWFAVGAEGEPVS